MNSFGTVDADGHLEENHIDWKARLPEQYQSQAPERRDSGNGQLRTIIEEKPCSFDNQVIPFTISIGVTTLHRETGVDAAGLIKRADENLYAAKRGGRNKVVPSLQDLIPA